MYFKKNGGTKLLILTGFNVSNVHYMIAQNLRSDPRFDVAFLDLNPRHDPHNDASWFGKDPDDSTMDLSARFSRLHGYPKMRRIVKLVQESQIVFASGPIAIVPILCRRPCIYFSYGSDLDQYSKYGESIFDIRKPMPGFPSLDTLRFLARKRLTALAYRLAFRRASISIIANYQFEDARRTGYRRLGFFPHPIETAFLNMTLAEKEENRKWIHERFDCDRALFSSTRQVWRKELEGESDYKGNNVALESLHQYITRSGDRRIKLFLVQKGPDVHLSEELIRELGIADQVVWLDAMPRRQLIRFYSGADVFLDEFGRGCLALCAIEALTCGTPTISYIGRRNSLVPSYDVPPPVLNTRDPAEISDHLALILSDAERRRAEEENAFRWVRENCGPEAIRESFSQMIESLGLVALS